MVEEFGHGGIGRYAVDVANLVSSAVDTVVATTEHGPVDGLRTPSTTWFPRGKGGRLATGRAAVTGLLRAARSVNRDDAAWVPLGIRPLFELLLVAALRARRARTVATVHNRAPHRRTGDSPLVSLSARWAHHVVVHSEAMQTWAAAKSLPTVRLPFPPPDLGVEPAIAPAAVRARLGIPQDRLLLLFLGYTDPYKGPDLLLRALSIARQSRPDLPVHVLMAGRPSAAMDIAGLTQDLHLTTAVTLQLRWLEERTMAEFLSAADAVALPYRRIDNSGISALARQWRLPVVASDLPLLREAHRDAALFAPPGDAAALAECVTLLPGELPRLRAAASDLAGPDVAGPYQRFARQVLS
jgi:glycosyltransferase involved in cell wall biosynthesis